MNDLIQILKAKLSRWQRIDKYWVDVNARLAKGEIVTTMSPDYEHYYNAVNELAELLRDYELANTKTESLK